MGLRSIHIAEASAPRKLCTAGFVAYMCYVGSQTTAGSLFMLMLPISLLQLYFRKATSIAARYTNAADWAIRLTAAFMLLPCVLVSPVWAVILASAWYSKQGTINDAEYHVHTDVWHILAAAFMKYSTCASTGVV